MKSYLLNISIFTTPEFIAKLTETIGHKGFIRPDVSENIEAVDFYRIISHVEPGAVAFALMIKFVSSENHDNLSVKLQQYLSEELYGQGFFRPDNTQLFPTLMVHS